jgi:hypothetical protein
MKLEKHLKIMPGVDLQRALHILADYLNSENSKRTGAASFSVYTNEELGRDGDVAIYSQPTSIIIKRAQK